MATTPTPPNGNSPNRPLPSGSAPANNSGGKPRATIMLKKPGSQPVITPATPSMSGRIPSPSQSARKPAVKVQVDRAALGLSAARPSESIEGLDEYAKRAEALAVREEAKRKSGGKMSANTALHVDETGSRWARNVKLGIAAAVLVVGGVTAFLMYRTAHPPVDKRVGHEETRNILNDLAKRAELMKPFEEAETITVQSAKERLTKNMEEEVKQLQQQITRDRDAKRTPDSRTISQRTFIEKMLQYKDGWGKPLNFSIEEKDNLVIASMTPVDGKPMEPVKVRVRAGSAAIEKPVEKPAEK